MRARLAMACACAVLALGCAARHVVMLSVPPVVTLGDGTLAAEAVVDVVVGKTPPVQVGAWSCESRSWDEHGVARLRCTAPAGASDLAAALAAAPEIAAVRAAP